MTTLNHPPAPDGGPGWYQDPLGSRNDRYWNGTAASRTKLMRAGPELGLTPPTTGGDEHPLFSKHRRNRRTGDLCTLIGNRIDFVDSTDEPLYQPPDVIAWVTRRYAANSSDPLGRDLFGKLRRRQHGIAGSRQVRPMRRKATPDSAAPPYAHVAPLAAHSLRLGARSADRAMPRSWFRLFAGLR